MDVIEFITGAVSLVFGAIIIFVVIQTYAETYPDFAQYGWALMVAYIAGATIFLKYALSRK